MGVTTDRTPSARHSPTAGIVRNGRQEPQGTRTGDEFECQAVRGQKRQTRQRNAAHTVAAHEPQVSRGGSLSSWPENS